MDKNKYNGLSSFTVKTKSPRAYKAEQKKAGEIKGNLEHFTNEWLSGRISTERYKELKGGFNKQTERLVNSNFVKTYSVTMTETELKLFSEFLEQREYTGPVKSYNKTVKREYFLHYSPYSYHGEKKRPNKAYNKFKNRQEWWKNSKECESWLRPYKEDVDKSLKKRREAYAKRDSSGDLKLPLELKQAYGSKGNVASIKSDINYRINTKAETLKDGMTLNDYISDNFGKKGTKGVIKRLSKSKIEK